MVGGLRTEFVMTTPSSTCRAALLATLAAAGCGVPGLAQKGADTSVEADSEGQQEAPVAIDALDPAQAPLQTQTEIVVRGRGFEGEVRVWIGNTEVEVELIGPRQLVVTTPEVRAEAAVDVRVVSDLGEAVLKDGLRFTDDPIADDGAVDGADGADGGTDGADGADGGGDASGLVSGYTELGLYVVGCPSCLGFGGSVVGEAYAVLHEPTDGAWLDWLPGTGRCVNDPRRSTLSSTGRDEGASVYLQGGAGGIAMNRVRDGALTYYSASGLGTSDMPYNTSFDLAAPSASTPYTVTGAVRTVRDAFDAFEPIELLSDGAYAFADLSAGYALFQWAPTGVSDAMMINIQVYDGTTGAYRGEILCAASDSGSFVVPSSAFSDYYAYDLAAVWIYRWSMTDAVHPLDGSTIQGGNAVGLIGTATLVP
jgi:hypothetical protein